MAHDGNHSGLNDPRVVTRIFYGLVALCVLLFGADFFYDTHAHFGWEGLFGFFPAFGFVTFFLAVLAGKQLRKIVMRDEDYYDR